MLTCLNALLEMAATLICVNHLFCKKYYFRIHDAVFLLSEVIIIEIANYLLKLPTSKSCLYARKIKKKLIFISYVDNKKAPKSGII